MLSRPALFMILGIVLLSTSQEVLSQGCSDAGLCTVSGLKAKSGLLDTEEPSFTNRLVFGFSYGIGDGRTDIFTPYLTYDRMIASGLSVSGKLTYASIDGELGSNTAFGDLFATVNYLVNESADQAYTLSAGVKIPLSEANADDPDQSLPMVYQSSLESFDLILGASYSRGKLGINLGWQQPLTGEISNTFIAEQYPDEAASGYQTTHKFTRKADLLLRITYDFRVITDRLVIRPSLLPIYHVAKDTYIDRNGIEREISGSQGLTLNGNLYVIYPLSPQHALEFSVGWPFQARDARPDGLTRDLVAGLEYQVKF
jgi:hypothetical protein